MRLDPGITITGWRCSNQGKPLGFARFAAFGLVLELFVVKEQLFSGREQKLSATVDTLQHFVLEFH